MRIKSVIELSELEASAIAGTLATLDEILKYTEKESSPELNSIWSAARKAMNALKDFYKECYL